MFQQDWADWGVDQLRLRTVDFNNVPSQEKLKAGVEFIEETKQSGKSVYVHCKAGRGRSATLVACYLMKVMKKTFPTCSRLYLKHDVWLLSFEKHCVKKKDSI